MIINHPLNNFLC